MASLASEGTQGGKIPWTLVWIEDLSQIVWVLAHLELEMVLDQVVEGVDYWMTAQAEDILMSTGAAKWGVA